MTDEDNFFDIPGNLHGAVIGRVQLHQGSTEISATLVAEELPKTAAGELGGVRIIERHETKGGIVRPDSLMILNGEQTKTLIRFLCTHGFYPSYR